MNLQEALKIADALDQVPPVTPAGFIQACQAIKTLARAYRQERKDRNDDIREANRDAREAYAEGHRVAAERFGNGGW